MPSYLIVALLFLLPITICVGVFLWFPANLPAPPQCDISYYRVVVIPETPQLTGIKIQEYVILSDDAGFTPPANWVNVSIDNQVGFQLPERKAIIENRGFILKEVVVPPPAIYCDYLDNTLVELDDFPINTFYAAHYARDIQKYPYIDTETITWNSGDLEVRFGFIPPPFQFFQPLLNPLIGASSLNQWVVGIIGVIGAVIFTPIIKPVLTDTAQKALKTKINDAEKLPKPTAKLIISDKGDEKEIEIKKKR